MADQAAADILEAVLEVDVARDGVAVGRDPGLGVAALDQHRAPAGAEGGADDVADGGGAPQQRGLGLGAVPMRFGPGMPPIIMRALLAAAGRYRKPVRCVRPAAQPS